MSSLLQVKAAVTAIEIKNVSNKKKKKQIEIRAQFTWYFISHYILLASRGSREELEVFFPLSESQPRTNLHRLKIFYSRNDHPQN